MATFLLVHGAWHGGWCWKHARLRLEQRGPGDFLVKPDLFDAWTDDLALKNWLTGMCPPHPIGSFRSGVMLSGQQNEATERHYIACIGNTPSAFEAQYQRAKSLSGWRTCEIDTKHDAMVEQPGTLAAILDNIAHRHIS